MKYPALVFLKVNVDNLPSTSARASVRAMPTFAVFIRGSKVDEVVGADKGALESMVAKHAKAAGPAGGPGYWNEMSGGRKLGGDTSAGESSGTSSADTPSPASGSMLGAAASLVGSFLGSVGGLAVGSGADATAEERIPGGFSENAGGSTVGESASAAPSTATITTTYDAPCSAPGPQTTLAVRLATGAVITGTFSTQDKMGTVVEWVAGKVGKKVDVGTTFPRKKYTGALLDRTLAEEGLANRGQVVVM
ncbi:hypothetical protein HDU93_006170 [Gonapodya sp. JEL0774]|nr:hypothetical protein HDU93_006170 [Gonapodya sp. JEL0774]